MNNLSDRCDTSSILMPEGFPVIGLVVRLFSVVLGCLAPAEKGVPGRGGEDGGKGGGRL